MIGRGCITKSAEVGSPSGPARPRLIMPLSVEETKPRQIQNARPHNMYCKQIFFSMDTVVRVTTVASEGYYMRYLDDSSTFHHILLRSSSWPLVGFSYRGVDH